MENHPLSTGKNNEKLEWNVSIDQRKKTGSKSPDLVFPMGW